MLEQVAEVQMAVLFGSVARRAAGSKSDLDVGVSLRGRDSAELLPELRVALERATGRAVDLISLEEAAPLLRFEIARGGRVLVATKVGRARPWLNDAAATLLGAARVSGCGEQGRRYGRVRSGR